MRLPVNGARSKTALNTPTDRFDWQLSARKDPVADHRDLDEASARGSPAMAGAHAGSGAAWAHTGPDVVSARGSPGVAGGHAASGVALAPTGLDVASARGSQAVAWVHAGTGAALAHTGLDVASAHKALAVASAHSGPDLASAHKGLAVASAHSGLDLAWAPQALAPSVWAQAWFWARRIEAAAQAWGLSVQGLPLECRPAPKHRLLLSGQGF